MRPFKQHRKRSGEHAEWCKCSGLMLALEGRATEFGRVLIDLNNLEGNAQFDQDWAPLTDTLRS